MSGGASEYRSIFDYCQEDGGLDGLRDITNVKQEPLVPRTSEATSNIQENSVGDSHREGSLSREVADRMICLACQCPFDSREEQMEHYKLDWHRFNLRQRVVGLPPDTVEEFERKTGIGDMSSISGTDSDTEDSDSSDSDWAVDSTEFISAENDSCLETDPSSGRLSSRAVFQNSQGQYLAVFRCVLQAKSNMEVDLLTSLQNISGKAVWILLMTGGGHFAGAVFQGKEVLQHKTFHRYTVRAKRGTAQGLRDAKDRSHTPKSAGAALRRHNEAALVKEIQDLLESWAEHLKEASLIFLRAPSYNKNIFFSGRTAPMDKKDPRVRTLPFATRRATFREIKRVHEMLSTLYVYEKETDVSDILSPSKKVWKKKKAAKPTTPPDQDKTTPPAGQEGDESSSEDGEVTQLETVEVTLSTLDLREHEIQPSRPRKRRRRKEGRRGEVKTSLGEAAEEEDTALVECTPTETQEKSEKKKGMRKQNGKTQPVEERVDESWEYGLRDALYTACKVGDVDTLHRLLQLPQGTGGQVGEREEGQERKDVQAGNQEAQQDNCPSQCPGALSPLALINKPIDSSGFTLLHVASAAGQKAVVRLLMDVGGDPACRDKKGQPPYAVAPEKDTRNIFRKYMAENPDKYNYSRAQVPGPLTAELESKKTEKKKAQKAAKKQKEKDQKEEKRKQDLEMEEKKRFAGLSDREKRALAAEKRLAEQNASTRDNLSNTRRCWQCGESLLGKVPFQYLDFTFCTPRCVQAHRKANSTNAKT